MHTFEANLSLLYAHHDAAVALMLAQAASPRAEVGVLERVPTAVKPVSWAETAPDWLDTPAAHSSPLDDY